MSKAYDRYPEIDSILRQALEASREDRDALLVDRCGEDAALREEIDRLLAEVDSGGTLDPVFRLSSEFLTHSPARTMIGTSLSHYEITAKLGEGGMGEVYRATDTKLGRDVAIKVLPRGFADDRERVSRFEREAKVLASFSHPSIAQVYDFDQHGDTHFLVMELADGETLADRIERGPIPLQEAMTISSQIAEALEAAHDQGIIHRDLKPANVNVSAGRSTAPKVKVLDFGLARLTASPSGADPELTSSPTLTQPPAAGLLMGTAAYMSPEQARGQEADARSDIWAFGCVLYEMLTARRAFGGDNVSDILAAVLKEEPDWTWAKDISANLRSCLKRSLSKDPAMRWHHVADLRLVLADSEPDATDRPDTPSRSEPRRGLLLVGVALVGLGMALGYLAAWSRNTPSTSTSEPPYRTSIEAPLPGSGPELNRPSVSISADGRRLAVSALGKIWVREARDDDWRPVGEGAAPRLAPNGRHLLAGTEAGQRRIPFDGGASVSFPGDGFARWLDDERSFTSSFIGVERQRIELVEPDGARQTLLDCEQDWQPCWDKEDAVALVADDAAIVCRGNEDRRLYLWRRGTAPSLILENACYPKKIGNRLFFRRGNEIWAVSIDPTGSLNGQAVPTGIEAYSYNFRKPLHFDVSETGTLFYLEAIPTAQLFVADSAGRLLRPVPLEEPIAAGTSPTISVSPDSIRVLVVADREVRVVRLEDGFSSRIVRGDHARWIDDETFVVSHAWGDTLEIYDRQAGLVRSIPVTTPDGESLDQWSRIETVHGEEGIALLTVYDLPTGGSGLLTVDLEGEGNSLVWHNSPSGERYAAFSPNLSWIAWEDMAGDLKVNASPWGEEAWPVPVSNRGGEQPRWSKDGKTLFFFDADRSHLLASDLTPDREEPFSPPRVVMTVPERIVRHQESPYDTLADGGFLFVIADREMHHRLVFNWLAEVDAKLAAAN